MARAAIADAGRFFEERSRQARLLFVAHRREILEQACATFRAVLRIADFGELLVGPHTAVRCDHLFASVDMVQSRRLWERLGAGFFNFVVVDEVHHDYEPELLLDKATWATWKARAKLAEPPADPDLARLQAGLVRVAQANGPTELRQMRQVIQHLQEGDVPTALNTAGEAAIRIHYRLWGKPGSKLGLASMEESFRCLALNPAILADAREVADWAMEETQVGARHIELPFSCHLELHANYSSDDIKAALGKANLATAGERGVGVLHFADLKAYALLVTFQKTEREFSPSTMYADYPISRALFHWESQANTAQASVTGQNLIHHATRGYTILLFARAVKKRNGNAMPFVFLGPARRVSYQRERPIQMVWQLEHPMPAEMFEENRRGG